jgi:hypothetical protein
VPVSGGDCGSLCGHSCEILKSLLQPPKFSR